MVFQQLAETPSLDRLSQFCFLEGDRRSLEPFLWHKETRERYNFLLNNRLHFEEKSAREEISYKELLLESKVEVSKKELLSLISLFERRGVSKIDSFSLKPLEEKDRYQLTLRLLERKRCL